MSTCARCGHSEEAHGYVFENEFPCSVDGCDCYMFAFGSSDLAADPTDSQYDDAFRQRLADALDGHA